MSEGLEALKRIKGDVAYQLRMKGECVVNDDFQAVEKELKALEVIEEKGLSINDIAFIKNGESWETYVETTKELYWGDGRLDKTLKTKEEYNLLREVLS